LDWIEDAGEDLLQQGFEEMKSHVQDSNSVICIQLYGMYMVCFIGVFGRSSSPQATSPSRPHHPPHPHPRRPNQSPMTSG
jgi:hypothetical protein